MKERIKLEKQELTHERINQDPAGLFLEQLEQNPELAKVKPSEADLSYLSPEQRAESLWATFQNIKGLVSGRKRKENGKLSEAEKKKLMKDPIFFNPPYVGNKGWIALDLDSKPINWKLVKTLLHASHEQTNIKK